MNDLKNMSQSLEEYYKIYSIMVIGDERVGKTSIISTYTKSKLENNISVKELTIKNNRIKIEIHDSPALKYDLSERNPIQQIVDGVVIVYDVTNEASFEKISNWVEQVISLLNDDNKPIFFLIGNKSDLDQQRQVRFDVGKKKANFLKCNFMETSIWDEKSIEKAFNEIINKIYNKGENNCCSCCFR